MIKMLVVINVSPFAGKAKEKESLELVWLAVLTVKLWRSPFSSRQGMTIFFRPISFEPLERLSTSFGIKLMVIISIIMIDTT